MRIGRKTAWTMYGLALLSALLQIFGVALGILGFPFGGEAFSLGDRAAGFLPAVVLFTFSMA